MPWPALVQRQFDKVPANPSEADFHGPYNKLLYMTFPHEFTVVPQYLPGSRGAADFFVMFEVLLEDRVVFILEVKPPGDLDRFSRRATADNQIRERIADVGDSPLPTLYAISAMGTKICIYTKPRDGRLAPRRIPSDSEELLDVAPKERWNYDILEEGGIEKFKAIVEEIKQGCAAL